MRVLFLCKHGVRGPSSRYRVHQLIPGLEARGVACVVRPFVPDKHFLVFQQRGGSLRKAFVLLACVVGRVGDLFRCRRADVVVVQREVCPVGPPVFEALVAWMRKPLVCDFDDAIYMYKPSMFTRLGNWLRSTGRFHFLAKRATITTVANLHLEARAKEITTSVRYLREVEDTQRIHPSMGARDGPITIGWIGSPSTVKYLQLIEAPLARLLEEQPSVRLLCVGAPWRDAPFPVDFEPWTLATEAESLRKFDIGLMPVPDDEWGRGKSGCKARQYMASGVAPVASPVGFNCHLIQDGETGLLPDSLEAWYEALTALVRDAGLRTRLGHAARVHVEAHYDLERGVDELHAVLLEAQQLATTA